jgi:hypothetical protein
MSLRKNIVLVGSNPGSQSPDLSAFHPSTKSRQFIDNIFRHVDYEIIYLNLIDIKMPNNKPLTKSMIQSELENIKSKFKSYDNYKVISFGTVASYGLELADIEHFAMPHPSGLCRFWNDRDASIIMINRMFEWIMS